MAKGIRILGRTRWRHIWRLGSTMRSLDHYLDDFSEANVDKIYRVGVGFEGITTATSEIEPEDIEMLKELMTVLTLDADAEAVEAQGDLARAMDNLAGAIREASASDGEEKGKDIYLVMDKAGTQRIAKATGVQLDKMHNTLLRS